MLLITRTGEGDRLSGEDDFAGYGALQCLDQLGIFYSVASVEALESGVDVQEHEAVVYPYADLGPDHAKALLEYARGGGVLMLGGLTCPLDGFGVAVQEAVDAPVPQVAAVFRREGGHEILDGSGARRLPVLSTGCFRPLRPKRGAMGLGRVVRLGSEVGAGVVVFRLEAGVVIVFGTNPFETIGYGMGMATAEREEHYLFPDLPAETHKPFNWKTNRAIKSGFPEWNLIWGDEHSEMILRALIWGTRETGRPLIWKWFWPDGCEFAATLQHDWDRGIADDARAVREAETRWGVKSALYVLVPVPTPPEQRGAWWDELRTWWERGWEVGLHADKEPGPGEMKSKMKSDMQRVAGAAGLSEDTFRSVVHHYIRYYKSLPEAWEELGFVYDASWYDMDWKSVFFTGTCRPFRIKRGARVLSVLELPARGDDNLWLQSNDAYYLGTGDFEMAVEGLHGYIDAIARKHGHASFCLHPTNRANTRREFDLQEEFVAYIKGLKGDGAKRAWFSRPIDVAQWHNRRARVRMTGRSESRSVAGSVISFHLDGEASGLSLLLPRRHGEREIRGVRVNGAERPFGAVAGSGADFAAILVDLDGRNPVEVSVTYGSLG